MSAESVYSAFLATVVADGVFSEAERDFGGSRLSDEARRKIGGGQQVDGRPPYLMRISGKGGPSNPGFVNVSLLDHLCSVVRGAVVFAEKDLVAAGVGGDDLARRLARVVAVAFLHDADKMIGLSRREPISAEQVGGLAERYRVDRFLASFGAEIESSVLVALIDEVEGTRAGRLRPGEPAPDNEALRDCLYVRLADRLEAVFLDTARGVSGVIEEMRSCDKYLRAVAIPMDWDVVRIASPHTPFLLDLLQGDLSKQCSKQSGIFPLIEVHHDGELLVVVPRQQRDGVVAEAVARTLGRVFKGEIRINVNNRNAKDILDSRGSYEDLVEAVERLDAKSLCKLLLMRSKDVEPLQGDISAVFGPLGFPARWMPADKRVGESTPVWSAIVDDPLRSTLVTAAVISLLVDCSDPAPALKLPLPGRDEREKELVALVEELVEVPPWLANMKDALGRRTLLAGVAAAHSARDQKFGVRVEALCRLWFEGAKDGVRAGLVHKIDDPTARFRAAAETYLTALLRGQPVSAENEWEKGRCLFTNMPVSDGCKIDTKSGLYGVNVTAFSGREGRPEFADRQIAETLVSPIAQVEQRIKARQAKENGRSGGSITATVSSPTSRGLFAALVYDKDQIFDVALSDALRTQIVAGKITLRDKEYNERRYRMERYLDFPTRLFDDKFPNGQVGLVTKIMEVALRTGRPIHVFRGLPQASPAFVHFDFLSPSVRSVLGQDSFRIEEIPAAVRSLRFVSTIAEVANLGNEVAKAVADAQTRFEACCLALKTIDRIDFDKNPEVKIVERSILDLLETCKMPDPNSNAIVDFAQRMALVQMRPSYDDGANVTEIGMKAALDAAAAASSIGQTASDSIKAAVGGVLRRDFDRNERYAAARIRNGTPLDQAFEDAVSSFVDGVWFGAFKGRSPASKNRRTAMAVYAYAFKKRSSELYAANPPPVKAGGQTVAES